MDINGEVKEVQIINIILPSFDLAMLCGEDL